MTTYYFWDEIEDNVVREYDENNNTAAQYATEPTLYGSVLSQDRRGEKRYFQFDGLGNTSELTNPQGNATDMRRYTAFGELSVNAGTTVVVLSYAGSLGYTTDEALQIVQIRNRPYDIHRARWLSADPSGFSDGPNRYAFCRNRSLSMSDPSGLETYADELFCSRKCASQTKKCRFEIAITKYVRSLPILRSPPPLFQPVPIGPLERVTVYSVLLRSTPAMPRALKDFYNCGGCFADFDRLIMGTKQKGFIRLVLREPPDSPTTVTCNITAAHFGGTNPTPWTGDAVVLDECKKATYFEQGVTDGWAWGEYFFRADSVTRIEVDFEIKTLCRCETGEVEGDGITPKQVIGPPTVGSIHVNETIR